MKKLMALICLSLAATGAVADLQTSLVAAPATPAAPSAATAKPSASAQVGADLKFSYGRFGEVFVYRPVGAAKGLTLFVSGDGGWNLGVVDMARHLVKQGSVVVGIDIRHYRQLLNAASTGCQYFGADFEGLSHEVQQRLGLPEYLLPVLVGYSSGATLVYAVAIQAPKGTFAGVMSLGFCPDLDLVQPVCRRNGLEYHITHAKAKAGVALDATAVNGLVFHTSATNATPWVVLQGDADQVCVPEDTRRFVNATGSSTLFWLPKVGHGYSVERNWLPQFLDGYRSLQVAAVAPPPTASDVRDLPLVEVPAKSPLDSTATLRDAFAVLLTGDGGWAGLDQDVAGALANAGVPVVALNSLKYYWKARDPASAAADLQRVIQSYGVRWNRERVVLIGYSFGADVLPYLYNRLPQATRARVASVSLLGLSADATFEFHVSSWIPGSGSSAYPTVPEIERMNNARLLCLAGDEQTDSPCGLLKGANIRTVKLPGGHHFGGDYAAVARQIVDFAVEGATSADR